MKFSSCYPKIRQCGMYSCVCLYRAKSMRHWERWGLSHCLFASVPEIWLGCHIKHWFDMLESLCLSSLESGGLGTSRNDTEDCCSVMSSLLLAQAAALLRWVWDVPGLNLNRDFSYSDWSLSRFFLIHFRQMLGNYHKFGHAYICSRSFQVVIVIQFYEAI